MEDLRLTDKKEGSSTSSQADPAKKDNKKFKWFAFGCLTSLVLLALLIFSFVIGITVLGRRSAPQIRKHSILNLVISGDLEEHREVGDMFTLTPTQTASQIVSKINHAAIDPAIDGILLEPRFLVAGYPVLNEVIEALQDFRQTGKIVYAYLEMSSNSDYYLASAADEIFLNPAASSGIYLSGVSITSLYMKDLLEKLGIEMTVLHAGKYKGAGEEFSRSSMSPEFRESLNELLDHFYDQFIQDIADRRELDVSEVRDILEDREELLISGQDAVNKGLVDVLMSREEILEDLKNGDSSRIVRFGNYKPKEQPFKYDDAIAVVYLQGMIAASTEGIFDIDTYLSSTKVKRLLQHLETDYRVKSIVLRINSPGGSALESDIIYHIIDKIKVTKPIIVSMGSSATSGAYYISAPANYIVADPYTITGSIGVAGMIPNFDNMMKSIGVNVETMQRGKYSNFLNPFEATDPNDIEALQKNLDRIYDEFVERVAEGRNMTFSEVHQVAQGRMWTSKGALDAGLIDEIGTLNDAVNVAAEMQNLTEYDVMVFPRTRSFFELLMERRFDITALKDIAVTHMLPEEKMKKYVKMFNSMKEDPIQFIGQVIILDW